MAEVKIKNSKTIEVLKVTIGDMTYSLPLITSLKIKQIRKLKECKTDDELIEFLSEWIERDALEDLTPSELKQIILAWRDATTGIGVGESSAS